jgi:hypothetical protein
MCREVVILTPRTLYLRWESPRYEAEWASEAIWTFWGREKFLAGIRTADLLARSLAITLTTLTRLTYINTPNFYFFLISLNTKSTQKYILNNVINRGNKTSVEHNLYSQ